MAKDKQLSHNFVKNLLIEDSVRYPYIPAKLNYFCERISEGYKIYRSQCSDAAGIKSFEEFAREVIQAHNNKFNSMTEDLKQNYYRQPDYLRKIVSQKCESLINKNNPDHIFTFVNPKDDSRVDHLKEIINGYYWLIKDEGNNDIPQTLLKRLINQMISGIRLISVNQYADAFIIWRSLLENVSYLKIMIKGKQKTSNLFAERKNTMKKMMGLAPASKAELDSLRDQAHSRAKSAKWWEHQRFVWAKGVVNIKSELSARTLQEAAGLARYYPHYQVASVFTHEHLIDESDFKVIALFDYLIELYWRAFEEIRLDIIALFKIEDGRLEYIRKHEENMRLDLKSKRSQFEDFSLMIS
ncbi:MAG TPA: DUF5677 domain-containing protein [Bacilli bacterium]|nr:DUF5677 domain-containing protein [Bacilli bacterium]